MLSSRALHSIHGFIPDESVQVAEHLLDAAVGFPLEQVPLQLGVGVPFVPLAKFPAHEEEFFAGVRPHIGVEQPQVGELLPHVSGHLVEEGLFAVDHFVVR